MWYLVPKGNKNYRKTNVNELLHMYSCSRSGSIGNLTKQINRLTLALQTENQTDLVLVNILKY